MVPISSTTSDLQRRKPAILGHQTLTISKKLLTFWLKQEPRVGCAQSDSSFVLWRR